jgi:probable rRNA maturation factor
VPVDLSVSGAAIPRPLARRVERWAERMLAALALPSAVLSVHVCDDATIHALNRQYRRKDKPTDVLAFAAREARGFLVPPELLGDVVISIETAARQAAAAGKGLDEELAMLLAHGLLHLLGDDHRDRREERRMTARTDALRSVCRVRGVSHARPHARPRRR